ncbi:MAG: hypothetical protein IJ013_01690 [Bacteroidaceae bacterium]|nr:hypothetical protein [Bacteroidaceae bacterium]
MNKKNFVEVYEAPRVETVEVAVEKGFASSGTFMWEGQVLSEEEWDPNLDIL